MTGDLTIEKDCQDLVQNTINAFKRLDVLVANAGIISAGGLQQLLLEDFDRIMRLNCRSVVYLNKLVIPYLEETKGNIVNVSSGAGLRAVSSTNPYFFPFKDSKRILTSNFIWEMFKDPNMLAYCMSKTAVVQLTRCAALELGPKGIRVNAVCPGVVLPTNLLSNAGLESRLMNVMVERAENINPLRRTGTPEEVAQSIVFLASEEDASYTTGLTLSIDGGRLVT